MTDVMDDEKQMILGPYRAQREGTSDMTDDEKQMTMDEFSDSCARICSGLHDLINNQIDDEADPMGCRKAIVAQHLKYILDSEIMKLLGG
jgi:hypothetical protein